MNLRNATVNGRRTSLRMEAEIWSALDDIAGREGMTIDALVSAIDSRKGPASLTGAVRVYALSYFRAVASQSVASQSEPAIWGVEGKKRPAYLLSSPSQSV